MPELMHHWYWARVAAGPYSVIASYITAEKRCGYDALPVFMLARDGKPIADDGNKVTFEELGRYTDTSTGKPVGNVTRYVLRWRAAVRRHLHPPLRPCRGQFLRPPPRAQMGGGQARRF